MVRYPFGNVKDLGFVNEPCIGGSVVLGDLGGGVSFEGFAAGEEGFGGGRLGGCGRDEGLVECVFDGGWHDLILPFCRL